MVTFHSQSGCWAYSRSISHRADGLCGEGHRSRWAEPPDSLSLPRRHRLLQRHQWVSFWPHTHLCKCIYVCERVRSRCDLTFCLATFNRRCLPRPQLLLHKQSKQTRHSVILPASFSFIYCILCRDLLWDLADILFVFFVILKIRYQPVERQPSPILKILRSLLKLGTH